MSAALQPIRTKRRYTRRPQGGTSGGLCSRCNIPHERNGRYCTACHAEYMREWRKTHPLTADQRLKDNARSMANVYKRRGKLNWAPCERCGSVHSEMHHHDYSKPLDVCWLCRPCHLELHRAALDSHGTSTQANVDKVIFANFSVSQ